jgi:hypothetical protein
VTDPAQMPVREARDRSPKSPRWSAGRRASRVMGRKAPRKAPGLPRQVQAHGCLASTRRLSALRHPSIGASEAKSQKPGRKNAPRERDRLCEKGSRMYPSGTGSARAAGRSASSALLPSPLWGGSRASARGVGVMVVGRGVSTNCDPHPQPLPTRGRGAHRVRGKSKRDGLYERMMSCFFHALAVLILEERACGRRCANSNARARVSKDEDGPARALMFRDASQRAFAVDSPISRCDAPQHEGEH